MDVFFNQLDRQFHILRLAGFDDGAMLGIGGGLAVGQHDLHAQVTFDLVVDRANQVEHERPLRRFVNARVKRPVHFCPPARIFACQKIIEDGIGTGEMFFGEIGNGVTGDLCLKQHPHFENLRQFRLADASDHGPAIALELHQTFGFQALEGFAQLPAVIYNSPYYGFATRADLFFELRREFPNLIGFKEFGGAADLRYAAEFITSKDDAVTLMVGVDTQVVHGFVNCNATGAITGIGNALPREVLHLVQLSKAAAKGDAKARQQAKELEAALAVLSSFDEGTDLVLYYKYLMVLNGDLEYTLHFYDTDVLSDSQRRYAETQYALFRAWYAQWSEA